MNADRYPVLALVDLQTQEGNLMYSKFVHLYGIPTSLSEKKTLLAAIQGSQSTIDQECTIQLDWIGYLQEHTFYMAHLSGWDMILQESALTGVNVHISTSKKPVSI